MYYDLEEKHKHEKQSSYELGIESGMEQGSKQEKIEIAKNLLNKLPIEEIAEVTGLSKEEIENL